MVCNLCTVVMNKVIFNTLLIFVIVFLGMPFFAYRAAAQGESEDGEKDKNTTTSVEDSSVTTAAQSDTTSGASALVMVQACLMSLPLVLLAHC
ncbi:unnamed protein product [Dibothriocephalus latus]|uniref:Uncharacterized protein n=1 Tax=Dibothriocephalus latus TaxID=60516 RepID=A0A3P6TDB8_DIBLA|nr:unnamed protein product [Dibothriocephalus latus]